MTVMPIIPPMIPPTPWIPAHPQTPPHAVKAGVAMKKLPIINPAIAAEPIEISSRQVMEASVFLNIRLGPRELEAMSKTMLAAVKPRNWIPPGFNIKLISVAIKPTVVTAPNFLISQNVRLSDAKPIMSHRIGRPINRNTIGANNPFRIPQSAENSETIANSRLLK